MRLIYREPECVEHRRPDYRANYTRSKRPLSTSLACRRPPRDHHRRRRRVLPDAMFTRYVRVHEVIVCANPFWFAVLGMTPFPFTLTMNCVATVESM